MATFRSSIPALLFLTGILLLLVYEPSTERAYASILILTGEVPFGQWVRNIHHWSANLLAIVAVLHLLRVVLTGAFGSGRRLNWVIGLLLLFLLLSSNFTGYLLPWDQQAYWAVTICTGMLGYIPSVGIWLQELLRGGAEVAAGVAGTVSVVAGPAPPEHAPAIIATAPTQNAIVCRLVLPRRLGVGRHVLRR